MKFRLSNNLYGVLKWLGLIAFPALATFLGVVLPVWGTDAALINALVVTINAIGTFIGALIGISALNQ